MIPPSSTTTLEGTCTLDHDGIVVGQMPHMHQLGTHLTATLRRADGEEQVLHDANYSFDLQAYEIFDPPIDVRSGDRIDVVCTWDNPTAEEVVFGTSSSAEMCFAGILRDAGSADSFCVE